jgi:hypothetical protein
MKAFVQAEQFFWSNINTDEGFKDAIWTSISWASCLLMMIVEDLSNNEDKKVACHARFDGLVESCGSLIKQAIGQW